MYDRFMIYVSKTNINNDSNSQSSLIFYFRIVAVNILPKIVYNMFIRHRPSDENWFFTVHNFESLLSFITTIKQISLLEYKLHCYGPISLLFLFYSKS